MVIANLQDDIYIYHDTLAIVMVKNIPLMAADATFSNVINDADFDIIHKARVVPYVESTQEPQIHSDEPLKFDI
ncbi:hypothetical protein [Erysipelothrix sp. HDW6A]|uniref:hypothetical protein n=1 Tax=Erysipelothrix sp. HDW6A TaxID=2714928 RepID=UPI001F0DCB79|nr:hypothetical protein [Erysipelothrix sp. HDW6A]